MMTLDTQLLYFLNSAVGQSPLLDSVIVFFASYLAYLLIVLFLALVLFSAYTRRMKWELLLVAGVSALVARFGIAELIRFFFHRPRPFTALPDVHQLFTDSAWSFPSGHATFFFALATALYLYNKKWGTWFLAAAALVTLGRVIAGVHYPSDIVGGALIGSAVAFSVVYGVRWLEKR